MTKRLTPDEDKRFIEDLERVTGSGWRVHSAGPGEAVYQIDKSKHEMIIEREGERFLEVRFKRRKSVDAGKAVAFELGCAHNACRDSTTGCRGIPANDPRRKSVTRFEADGPFALTVEPEMCPEKFKGLPIYSVRLIGRDGNVTGEINGHAVSAEEAFRALAARQHCNV